MLHISQNYDEIANMHIQGLLHQTSFRKEIYMDSIKKNYNKRISLTRIHKKKHNQW